MRPRQNPTDLFSTFVLFADEYFAGWATDPRLKRSIICCLEQIEPEMSGAAERFCVIYWHHHWQAQPMGLANEHLSAYLQEACYWAASRFRSQLVNKQTKLTDCFQTAIADLPKILKGYHPDQGASLKTYASLCFSNIIRDTLRQQREADSRTDWGLLRKISQKRLTEALQAVGFSEEAIAYHRLAWTCFKVFCAPTETPSTRQLANPNSATWEAIAQLYNTQRDRQLPTAPVGNPKLLEQWLKACAKRIRAYLYPATTSLNASQSESGIGELQDDLPDLEATSPLADLIRQEEWQERQAQRSQVSQVLSSGLNQLSTEVQTLLELYYAQALTQQQIAQQLEIKQYTVSRRLSNAKEKLLLTLAKWSQETLHISLTSTVVNDMYVVLEEWLQTHYRSHGLASKDVP